ncbi:MAG: THUMP domain-containing protein [Candidatus Thorarchaeota archaeon]
MPYFCVFLLGDNIPLAMAEIESLVNLVDESNFIRWKGRFGIISCNKDPASLLVDRAVLLRETGKLLISSENVSTLEEELEDIEISGATSNSAETRFAVKVQDMDSTLKSGEKDLLASIIGKRIVDMTKWSVSLKHPNRVFTLFVGKNSCYLSESSSSRLFKDLEQTGRNKRSFFHPSMMNAVLARVMCNIAGTLPSHTLLDPFCGAGGILVEGGKIGLKLIGIDTSWQLLNGARQNLQSISCSDFNLIQGDSQNPPLSSIDYIVTDPPYGRTSSTHGTETAELVGSFISHLIDWEPTPVICICGDAKMKLGSLFTHQGGHIQYQIPIPVHRSLTREVIRVVF